MVYGERMVVLHALLNVCQIIHDELRKRKQTVNATLSLLSILRCGRKRKRTLNSKAPPLTYCYLKLIEHLFIKKDDKYIKLYAQTE